MKLAYAALIVSLTVGLGTFAALAQDPWDTPIGRECFEQWIREAEGKINNFNGSEGFNIRKPWFVHRQWGVLNSGSRYGPTSVSAPDDFYRYRNKYHYMWVYWHMPTGRWLDPKLREWNQAGVPQLRPYVLQCIAERGGVGQGPAAPPPVAPPAIPPVGGNCDIAGTWRHTTGGVQAVWTFTSLGGGRYAAQERGLGNATGTAVISGYHVRVDWVTGSLAGIYEWDLNVECTVGSGRLVFTKGRAGTQSSRLERVGGAGSGGMETNVNRPGGDYRSFDLSAARPELCRDACLSDPQCRAYTYVRPGVQGPSARCWLKSVVPNPVASDCCVSGVSGRAGAQPPIAQPPIAPPVAPPAGGVCDISGSWRHTTESVGSAVWTFTPLGGGRYAAREQGLANATGTAVVAGYRVRVDWTTGSGSGYYEWTLNPDCTFGSGRLVFTRGRSTTHASRLERTGGRAGSGGMEANVNRPGGDYRSFDLSAARPELCRDACLGDPRCRAYTYVRPGIQGPYARCWLKSVVPNPVASDCCVSGVR